MKTLPATRRMASETGRMCAEVYVHCPGCGKEQIMGQAPLTWISWKVCAARLVAMGWHKNNSYFRCGPCHAKDVEARRQRRKARA